MHYPPGLEEKLRTLETVPNSYLILSPDLHILTASDVYLQATATKREVIVGQHIFEAFPDNPDWPEADGVKNINESLQIVLNTKKSHQMRIQKYDVPDNNNPGRFIAKYWEPSHTPVLDENGKILYIIQLANDVTSQIATKQQLTESSEKESRTNTKNVELVKAQQELQTTIIKLTESEVKTNNIIKNAPFPIGIYIGREMRIEFVNQSIIDVWGKGPDVIGRLYAEVLPELQNQSVYEQLDQVFTTGIPFHARNQRIDLFVNGELKPHFFNYSFTPLLDSSGKIYGVMNTAADVTDIVQAKLALERNEQELQVANEELATTNEELQSANEELQLSKEELIEINTRFDIALEAGSFGSTEVDLATGKMVSNDQFKRLFGRSTDDEMTYADMFDAMLPEHRERVRELAISAREKKTIYKAEYEIKWPDGSIHWISAHGRARYSADGVPTKMIGILSEVTEIKEDEQRKNDFIGMVSHELKTPLTSLNGYLQLLSARTTHYKDDFLSNGLDKAKQQVKKMTKMINGFLNLSRFESGKIHIDYEYFDITVLIQEVKDEALSIYANHEIIFNHPGNIWLNADKDKIGHVITNFISNAVKYSPSATAITINCTVKDRNCTLSVADQGIGIAEKDLAKLFDRYYRVEGHQMQTVSGFGIGLYICKEIIERHNGKIWVESNVGHGSTFFFQLPL